MTLPTGFVVRLGRRVRVLQVGGALLGGFPLRLVRLAPRARPMLVDRTVTVRSPESAALADRLLDAGLAEPVAGALPEVVAAVTVVVPVRDRPGQLDRLLTSIAGAHPVVVVDDASADPGAIADVVARHGARLIPLPVNLGPAGARNAGLGAVPTPFVAFVDSDVVLTPETIPTLLRHTSDPRVAMVGPRIRGVSALVSRFQSRRAAGGDWNRDSARRAHASWLARYEDTRSSLDLGPHPAAVRPRSPLSWITTACAVARVEALRDGFDPALRVAEDVDLGWRLIAAGWRVRYEPAAVAQHEHRERPVDWFLRKAAYGTGAQPLAERHPGLVAPAVFAPWSAALVVALAAQRRWSAPVACVLVLVAAVRIAARLHPLDGALVVGLRLAGAGAVSATAQSMALLLRHWWPAAAIACLVSRRVRRAVLVAAVLDVVLEYRRDPAHLDPLRFALARRLDDLAYGAGVWWGALRAGSTAALRPAIVRRSRH